ncbi:hypothetical protein [Cohnella mopanensis]|uniref:hypothetical protein n=1 Tax=Cohnella mopanensis TaxID=2911966 RepID=UPI001EF78B1C|nr:hypothetical protein [Cohnella mopanensis]
MAQDKRVLDGITVKVSVDVSEALTGLKALQREAKKATQAIAELNAAQEAVNMTELN